MALDNPQSHVTYTGNGATIVYDAPFPVYDIAHIVVSGTKSDGTPFAYVQGVDYQTHLNFGADNEPVSASITLAKVLPSGWKMKVARIVPIVQPVEFSNQGEMSPDVVENSLDYLTMIAQQLAAISGTDEIAYLLSQFAALRAVDTRLHEGIDALDDAKADNSSVADVEAGLLARIAGITQSLPKYDDLADALKLKVDRTTFDGFVAQLQQQVNTLNAGKADTSYVDAADQQLQSQISNLETGKAKKADVDAVDTRLQEQIDDVSANKADKTDPRLTDARTPLAHAGSHARGGADALTAAAIGAVDTGHLSVADPHPQYVQKGDWTSNEFFVFDAETGSLRLRASIPIGTESAYLVRTATGIALKGVV